MYIVAPAGLLVLSCMAILPHSHALRPLSAQAGSSEKLCEDLTTLKHLSLQRVFSKTYGENIFSITKNVRQYEWTKDEVETMFADFYKSMEPPEEQWTDCELGQVVVIHSILKNDTPQHKIPQSCLEVLEGQQRLVTLCLLYAAIREEAPEDQDLQRHVQEILIVKDHKKPPVPRLTLRENDNKWFQCILEGNCLDDMPTKEADIKKLRSTAEQRILENFVTLRSLLKQAMKDDDTKMFIDNLHFFLNNHVKIYLTIHENQRVARRFLMNRRKGKDIAPIDELKGMVIFSMEDEATQDICLERWNELACNKELFNDACVFMAEADLQRLVKTSSSQEMDLFEEWWTSRQLQGASFFDKVLKPGFKALEQVRAGRSDAGLAGGNPTLCTVLGLQFLYDIAKVTTAKQIEIAALHVLRYANCDANDGNSKHFVEYVQVLGRVGLLFATTKPSVKDRMKRICDITMAISNGHSILGELDLSAAERTEVKSRIDIEEWGSSFVKKQCVRAVLMRINAVEMATESETRLDGMGGTFHIEHILPDKPDPSSRWCSEWNEDDRTRWKHRLGNLCLLNGKTNVVLKNFGWSEKRSGYKKMPFPLTRILTEFDKWTASEVKQQHKHLLQAVARVFGL